MVPKNAKFSGGSLAHPTRGVFRPRRKFSKIRLAPYGNRVYSKGMKDQMTFEEFASQLPYIDWYYYMSDDGAAYRRGKAQVQRYRDLAIAMGGEWQEAFKVQEEKNRI